MGTNECSQPASKSSWDSQDFVDVNMVLKMAHFHKSSRTQWVKRRGVLLGLKISDFGWKRGGFSNLGTLIEYHMYLFWHDQVWRHRLRHMGR